MSKRQEALEVARDFIENLPDYLNVVITHNGEDSTETLGRGYVINKINEALKNEQ